MRTAFLVDFLLLWTSILSAQLRTSFRTTSIEISNSWIKDRIDVPVILRIEDLQPDFHVRSTVVLNGEEEIPSQLDDLNRDLQADGSVSVMNIPVSETSILAITLSSAKTNGAYPAHISVRMRIRDVLKQEHTLIQPVTAPGATNFYNMVHDHGPMLKSRLVAYRVYFNRKQTINPYGKFNKGLEVQESSFYPNGEQFARGFGDNVSVVGNSYGVRTLKGWDGAKTIHIEPTAFRIESILACGPIHTIVGVAVKGQNYQERELNTTNRYILYTGHHDLLVEAFFDEPLEDELFCTGVQNTMGNETLSDSDHKGLVGSWGRHWSMSGTAEHIEEAVSIATYIPQKYIHKEVEDKDNFLYTVSAPGSNRFHYCAIFISCKETFGHLTPGAWFACMHKWKEELQHPVQVRTRN